MSSKKFPLGRALLALAVANTAWADNTAHNLAGGNFSQDWTNTGLITANDDWSGVPSIVGFRGDALTGATGADPQTLLADDTPGVLDVNANRNDPDAFATGGATEFDGIANPAVALAGSGTADAPYLLIHLNSTGRCNLQASYNVRDLDGSADNATQQLALQYRVGGAGGYTNVGGAYVADGTTANAATQVTPVAVTLPVAVENAALVQLRIMTTNAGGNDEWLGIDDISITSTPCAVTPDLSISDVSLNEGNAGTTTFTFTVSLSAPAGPGGVTFDIATADGSATAPSDYTSNSLLAQTIPSGNTTYLFDVSVNGDTIFEFDENFLVNVTNVTGANVVDGQGSGSIGMDDAEPTLTATVLPSASITEGNAGPTPVNVTYTLSGLAQDDLTIDLHTGGGTADAADYNGFPMGDTVILPGGNLSTVYSDVTINGDTDVEPNETFNITVDAYTFGALRRTAKGVILPDTTVTIVNDDVLATYELSINDVSVTETDAAGTNAVFTVTLTDTTPIPRSPDGTTIASVNFTTMPGTAVAPDDYTTTAGTLNFTAAGTQTITVPITGDLVNEATENFTVVLSGATGATVADDTGLGTINDNDPLADLSATITDSPDPVLPGGTITYTVTLTNSGPDNAGNAGFSLPLPTGTTFDSLTAPGGWSCTTPAVGANGTVSCNELVMPRAKHAQAKMAPGTAVFTIVAAVDFSVLPGTVLTSTLNATSTTSDPNGANNAAPAATTVGTPAQVPPIPALDRLGQLLIALLVLGFAAMSLRRHAA